MSEILTVIIGVSLFVFAFLLPSRRTLHQLQNEVSVLKQRLDTLDGTQAIGKQVSIADSPTFALSNATDLKLLKDDPASSATASAELPVSAKTSAPTEPVTFTETAPEAGKRAFNPWDRDLLPFRNLSLEQSLGQRLPIWIGGIALTCAGFFMAKYSLEHGFLSPAVRMLVAAAFGIILLGLGHGFRKRSTVPNNLRIAQALSGAGIADLYACLFATVNLYHLISPLAGFTCMGFVTAGAVLLSLLHGMPIALLGMIGGFLTPALMDTGSPSGSSLFGYLYLVSLGLFMVIRRKQWWPLAIGLVLACQAWVLFWTQSGHITQEDGVILLVFLLFLSATSALTSHQPYEKSDSRLPIYRSPMRILAVISIGGSLVLAAGINVASGFGPYNWLLMGLLSAGTLMLASLSHRLYSVAPWVSLAANAVTLLAWEPGNAGLSGITIALLAVLYGVVAIANRRRFPAKVAWSWLLAATSLIFYAIAYDKLRHFAELDVIPRFWGLLALLAAAMHAAVLQQVRKKFPADATTQQTHLAIHAGSATALLSIALAVELPSGYLPIGLAGQLLGLAWVGSSIEIKALRDITAAVALVFAAACLPIVWDLLHWTILEEPRNADLLQAYPDQALLEVALPAVLLWPAALLLRRRREGALVYALEIGTVLLVVSSGYYALARLLHSNGDIVAAGGLAERSLFTNLALALGIGLAWLHVGLGRKSLLHAGVASFALGLIRLAYFDFIFLNPLRTSQDVGAFPVLNALLLCYGLPALFIWHVAGRARSTRFYALEAVGRAVAILVGFYLVSLLVRQIYHGRYLGEGMATIGEIYAYSMAWLVFGIILLIAGTWRKDKLMRFASLATMIATVGKVFLYDTSALEGLLRVFSFLGLGVSLLALSWFYTRFVFADKSE